MNIILHITKRADWEQAKQTGIYRGDTLDSEGFIHCSTLEQIIKTANRFFYNQIGLVILCIESDQVQAEIKYENVENQLFPHIYGALNIDAVIQVLELEPREDGRFEMLDAIVEVCNTFSWGKPESYEHIALRAIRRLDIVWTEDEVEAYEQIQQQAQALNQSMADYVKALLKQHFRDIGGNDSY